MADGLALRGSSSSKKQGLVHQQAGMRMPPQKPPVKPSVRQTWAQLLLLTHIPRKRWLRALHLLLGPVGVVGVGVVGGGSCSGGDGASSPGSAGGDVGPAGTPAANGRKSSPASDQGILSSSSQGEGTDAAADAGFH
ncbi:hypothetical protein Dimus_012361 [Dionaea muscipula]